MKCLVNGFSMKLVSSGLFSASFEFPSDYLSSSGTSYDSASASETVASGSSAGGSTKSYGGLVSSL